MPLSLYSTLSRSKEVFTPIDPGNVRMYVCGPTVYDLAHIGNARPVIVFDVLFRLLRHIYGDAHVNYVRNITDVDDKINAAAKANGETIRDADRAHGARSSTRMSRRCSACRPMSSRARPSISAAMIEMIERLIAADHAYAAEGHVLFAVASTSRLRQAVAPLAATR